MALYRIISTVCCALLFLGSVPAKAGTPQFKHVVVLIQENRTPDNLFESNPQFEPGVDIASGGVTSTGQAVPLQPAPLIPCYDLAHSHQAFLLTYNDGKMDGADRIRVHLLTTGCTAPPLPEFSYVDNSTGAVQPYFDIATQFGFANRMFQTNQGGSYPAHLFLFAATSAPSTYSKLFAAENVKPVAGCTADASARVAVIDPRGSETSHPAVYPCFNLPSLATLLNAAHLDWKYYANNPVGVWTAPNSLKSICRAQLQADGTTICTGPQWTRNVIRGSRQFLTDVADCKLPAVTWLIPPGVASDHAGFGLPIGPQWVASVINAIGSNPPCAGESYWNDTAIIVTWDDWGGWYDHVPPFRIGQDNGWGTGYAYGFRVPLLVVSAFTRAGYVDNHNIDFGTILGFIEKNFGLGLIGPGTYADAYQTNPLEGFFSRPTPRPFRPIATSMTAAQFMNAKLPEIDVDNE